MDMNLIRAMPIPQRIELVQEILDSIAVDTRKPTLGDELIAELDRRLEADEANPEAGVPWEQVEAAALAKVSAESTAGEMDAEVCEELDRRVAAYRANPSAAKPWDVVKASLRSRS